MPEGNAMICMYDDEDQIFFKRKNCAGKTDSCIDHSACEILRFWKCTCSSAIMVPCQVEQDEENKIRVLLPTEMVNVFADAQAERAISSALPTEIKENDDVNPFKKKDELLFDEMRTLSSRSRIMHKEDYPFVISAFAAQGLQQTPNNCVLYYSRRIGLFHLKKDDIIADEGGIDQYIRGIVSSPNHFSYLHGMPQPESAKSVKIVKTSEIIFKGCALLGYNDNPAHNDKPDMWIGWNDYTGLLTFDHACLRLLKQKHRDFDSRCAFVMFSAVLNRGGRWKAKDISYSRQEIVENEAQMPLDICFVDGLAITNRTSTEFKLSSTIMKTSGGDSLVVSCKKERFDTSEIHVNQLYGAVIVPWYSQNGTKVEFEAIAVLPNHKWVDQDSKFNRLAAILPTWEEVELPVVPETTYFLDVVMEKGYI